MKRTATTLALLAGFGGGCAGTGGPNAPHVPTTGGYGTVTKPMTAPGLQGPGGEPLPLMTNGARGAMPTASQTGAPTNTLFGSGVQPAGATKPYGGVVRAHVPGVYSTGSGVVQANGPGFDSPFGPNGPPTGGILPVPGMGPPGAVAAVGAMPPMMRGPVSNQRTSIRFTGPAGMKITWQLPGGGFNEEASGLTAPKEYNFLQSQVYRLRLTQILPTFPGRTFYPTLEVAPVTPKSITFLAHSSVPVTFTDEDFRQAADGNLVVKVIYLPDPAFQDFITVGGAEEIVSTRLEPGADPVAEAQKRGTVLATIRLGNIDLENRSSPSMVAPPPGVFVPGGPGMPPVMATPPVMAVPVPMGPKMMTPPPPGVGGPGPLTPPPVAKPVPPPAKPVGPGPLPPAVKGGDDAKPLVLPPLK